MRLLPSLPLLALLSSCAPSTGDSWFPLVSGFEQTYAVTVESEENPAPEEWTLRVTGAAEVDGAPVVVRHHSAGVGYYLREDEQGIRRVATRTDIDAIDICVPNDLHAEIAIAAAKAGKHIICEKPLARTVEEARAMTEAAKAAGIIHMVAFNYRRTPAVALAKRGLQVGKGARRRDDRRAHDSFHLGALHHSGNRRLRHVHDLGDLCLSLALGVIHLCDAGDKSKLVETSHEPSDG